MNSPSPRPLRLRVIPRAPRRRGAAAPIVATLAYVAALIACTPQDRATARTVISVAAPVGCALKTLVAPNGAFGGSVCEDVFAALSRMLATAPATTSSTNPVRTVADVSAPATCTRMPLPAPNRDPGEFYCAEVFTAVQVRNALEVGRAP